jgi:PAS domain S-box-containing protein
MRQMLEHLPFFAIMVDRNRRLVWVNRLDPTLTPEQVLDHRVDEFIHPEWLPLAIETIERAFTRGEIGHYEARAYGEGQVNTWYGTTVVPLPPNERGDERALLLSNDVTKQHLAEEALQASEQRFRLLTEASPDLIAIVDHEQRVLYMNRDPPVETGLRVTDVLGKTIRELTYPDFAELAESTVSRVLHTGEPGRYEARGARDQRHYVCRVIRISPPNESPRALITTTDVTAQRRADAEREVLAAQLQQSQKLEAIGQLAGGVAHDFNNLLLVIQNHVEFAERAVAEGGDPRPELAAIMTAAERAQEVTRGLLTIGRRQPRKAQVFDLSDLAVSSMKLWRRMIPESIDVDLDLMGEPAFINADQTQIEQVLMNLCLNARDAITGTGSIQVSVTRRGLDDEIEPGWITLIVSDTGTGMAPATLAHAFEPFFTTKPPGKGSGLGLSMVHSLTTQNGGRLSIESAWGKGTRVGVCFPEVSKNKSEAPPEPNRVVARRTGTILVTEDDALVRQIVVRVLQQGGYHVIEACNGQEAVDIFTEHQSHIDLVILDAVMPGMGGKEAYERIIQLQPNAKVLFSSGYSAEVLPESFLQAHGIVVLSKPYRPVTLLTAVERALNAESS